MTSRKEIRPKPSHPKRRQAKLGMKIRKFIEITNIITSKVKRLKKGSSDMYEVAKVITFLEINKTVAANIRPWGSKIRGSSKRKALVERSVHSTKVVEEKALALMNRVKLIALNNMRILEELRVEVIIIVLRKF